jgi:hypothetical protein
MNFEDKNQRDKRLSQLLSVTDRNTTEPDKEFLNKLQEKTMAEFMTSNAKEMKKPKTTFPLWRIIMESKISKYAAAVIVIAAIFLSYFISPTGKAYAFGQTLDALKDVKTVHLWARDWHNVEFEMWIQLNPKTGMPDYCRQYNPNSDYLAISRPDTSYQYNEKANQVQINSGRLFSIDVAPAYIFEQLVKYSKMKDSGIEVEISNEYDSELGKDVILAMAKTPMVSWKITIDAKTKLPISFHSLNDEIKSMGSIFKDVDKIEYNVELPKGIFDFEIPEDAKIIDHDLNNKILNDPQYGISTEGLTEQQAAEKIVTMYWNALIEKKYEDAKKVSPVWAKAKESDLLEELVEVGDIYIEPGCGIGKLIPCKLRYSDGSLKLWKIIIKKRNIDGNQSCVIDGFYDSPKEIE